MATLSGCATHHSDSTGDYRGIIDDLTVEIKTLKDELRRYKPTVPRNLRKDKLFEIRVHNLPKGQKRELETVLRDIATNFEDRPDAATRRRKVSLKHETQCHYFRSPSSHETSYRGCCSRPPDSAYASMSSLGTDASGRSGTSLDRPTRNQGLEYPDQLVEHYLHGIPAGLYPRNLAMTDKEKGVLVVRRLENLFTGHVGGYIAGSRARPSGELPRSKIARYGAFRPELDEGKPGRLDLPYQSTFTKPAKPSREKSIPSFGQQSYHLQENSRSTESGLVTGPCDVPTVFVGSCGPDNSTGPSINSSAKRQALEERPTRPTDLDPDRIQNPSENLGYIRHFGLVPLETFGNRDPSATSVHTDTNSWIYLNLLYNMAQLHLISVTAAFVRAAVASSSTNLQMSPDGSKIRWLGCSGGTKVSGERSRTYAHSGQDTSGSGRSKVSSSCRPLETPMLFGDNALSDTCSKKKATLGRIARVGALERFHYTPLLFGRESSDSLTSSNGSSPIDAVENGNASDLGSCLQGDGTSYRRKCSHDGAIIYYSGVPFCIDFSGDPRTVLPECNTASMSQNLQKPPSVLD